MTTQEMNFRKAADAFHRYMENPNNPLSGAKFSQLLDEFFRTKDEMIAAQQRTVQRT